MDSITQSVPLFNIRVYAQNDWSKTVATAPKGTLLGHQPAPGVRTAITANQITPSAGLVASTLYYVGADRVPGSNPAVVIIPYLLQFSGYRNGTTAVFTQ